MFNNSRNSNLPIKNGNKSNLLRYLPFTLSPLVLALFLSSNMAYAAAGTTCGSGSANIDASTACGNGANAGGVRSTAYGDNANAWGNDSISIGTGSTSGHLSVAVGKDSSAQDWGVAIGEEANAGGGLSVAIGQGAKSPGIGSTAIGTGSLATGTNSVALGPNSQAKNANEVNIGIWSGDTQAGTRTLSGLSDGVNPDEAVNKRQLNDVDIKAKGYASGALTDAKKYT
ncbi:hypothetical protein N1B16_003737, partial [Salmonella enterica subsp. enterica serovar Newport]|nr:hypothetical protein [Salmonella enterica subsp. enterica serovar Newport]